MFGQRSIPVFALVVLAAVASCSGESEQGIRGSVEYSGGRASVAPPPPDGSVTITDVDGEVVAQGSVDGGRFEVALDEGEYVVEVSVGGINCDDQDVTVEGGRFADAAVLCHVR